ncbi:MAG: lipid-A-disaccharide synthase N-terminal domain-containing protein [Alistipes sp.]|nr:lipid-A-disaccharide synthase N-terminal domain-containing protein [Alistipes sp.]
MSSGIEYAVGAVAQLLFSARVLVQWIASEKAHRIISPVLFWQLSMMASFLLCIYGWLRFDFAIVAGQLVLYYIYIWNLNIKGAWKTMHRLLRIAFLYIPLAAAFWCLVDWDHTFEHLFMQEDIPAWLIIFGLVGQSVFTFRFIYQWLYSRARGESLLPVTFWIISLTGSVLIITYALIRVDYIYIVGQGAGLVAYIRNIMIGVRQPRSGRQ